MNKPAQQPAYRSLTYRYEGWKPFTVSNDLIDDRAALEARWRQDGYWFFKGVIDRDAVKTVRDVYLDVLASKGVIERGDETATWTGKSLDDFPAYLHPLHELNEVAPWKALLCNLDVAGFFHRILGEPVIWLPMLELRVVRPDPTHSMFPHQDGFFYNDLPHVKTVWFPISDVAEDMGGLAVIRGLHNRPFLHDWSKPPALIDPADLPDEDWRSGAYEPGDVVLFDQGTPHTGLPNRSKRFRLSLDIRLVPASAQRPVVGIIQEVTPDHITLDAGGMVTVPITDATYIRAEGIGIPRSRHDVQQWFRPGELTIVGVRDGVASLIRQPHPR
jgi:ectoine hydroxylase-related dioxygenase (phytanoyl-CoA dioxygenase family)